MAAECWIDPVTHFKATGQVSGGVMTNATVEDNNGITVTRDKTFESKSAFIQWVRNFRW